MDLPVTRKTRVEELVEQYPEAVPYFIRHGVSPIFCDGAFPTDLGRLLEIKKVPNPDSFIKCLNHFLRNRSEEPGSTSTTTTARTALSLFKPVRINPPLAY